MREGGKGGRVWCCEVCIVTFAGDSVLHREKAAGNVSRSSRSHWHAATEGDRNRYAHCDSDMGTTGAPPRMYVKWCRVEHVVIVSLKKVRCAYQIKTKIIKKEKSKKIDQTVEIYAKPFKASGARRIMTEGAKHASIHTASAIPGLIGSPYGSGMQVGERQFDGDFLAVR